VARTRQDRVGARRGGSTRGQPAAQAFEWDQTQVQIRGSGSGSGDRAEAQDLARAVAVVAGGG